MDIFSFFLYKTLCFLKCNIFPDIFPNQAKEEIPLLLLVLVLFWLWLRTWNWIFPEYFSHIIFKSSFSYSFFFLFVNRKEFVKKLYCLFNPTNVSAAFVCYKSIVRVVFFVILQFQNSLSKIKCTCVNIRFWIVS